VSVADIVALGQLECQTAEVSIAAENRTSGLSTRPKKVTGAPKFWRLAVRGVVIWQGRDLGALKSGLSLPECVAVRRTFSGFEWYPPPVTRPQNEGFSARPAPFASRLKWRASRTWLSDPRGAAANRTAV